MGLVCRLVVLHDDSNQNDNSMKISYLVCLVFKTHKTFILYSGLKI